MTTEGGSFKPTLPIVSALPAGAQTAQQASLMRQQQAIDEQMSLNDMTGGNKNMRGGTAAPQLPTYGMPASPMDGNAQSYKMNNLNAQSATDSAGDDMIGKLPSQTGGKRRRKRGGSTKRKTRKTKKRSRKMKRTRKTKTSKRRNKRSRIRN